MRILTWNINGIRTVFGYHPWFTLKTTEAMLDELKADIVCFQETKIQRSKVTRDMAVPPSYDSFWSFCSGSKAYSGVSVHTKRSVLSPTRAEEGLTGLFPSRSSQPKLRPALDSSSERVQPLLLSSDMYEVVDPAFTDLELLDSEGRALVLDCGLFVLINVYCPAETDEARTPFKMSFHYLLAARVRALRDAGREVILVGDINIAHRPIDHCDGWEMTKTEEGRRAFREKPTRRWFDALTGEGGPLVDVHRRQFPDRKGMYTCWNTLIDARPGNYGTRIDYILISPALLPWLASADIQPDVLGSDHCPVYIDLHDSIPHPTRPGETLHLRNALSHAPDPPRICAGQWDEFSGKQRLLSSFFGKGPAASAGPTPPKVSRSLSPAPSIAASTSESPSASAPSPSVSSSSAPLPAPSSSAPLLSASSPPAGKEKGKAIASTSTSSSQQTTKPLRKSTSSSTAATTSAKSKQQQATLASFFAPPAKPKPAAPAPSPSSSSSSSSKKRPRPPEQEQDGEDADALFALSLAEAAPVKNKEETKSAWAAILAPKVAPKCEVHGETCKEFTVNKPGPNRGKRFWLCSRPVGPGYDAGAGKRKREDVDPTYRCNFFKWSSEIKRDLPSTSKTPSPAKKSRAGGG